MWRDLGFTLKGNAQQRRRKKTNVSKPRVSHLSTRVRRNVTSRLVVGFALETADGLRRAQAKMRRKGTDYVVLNDASALAGDRASVIVLGADGSQLELADRTKDEIAEALVGLPRPA